MAKLLEIWLNSEVELSRKVDDFPDDFSNGYLFGELLYKYNQQPDFEMFADKHSRNYRLNNFSRLVPTFKALGVKFNPSIINLVMTKQEGAATQLLYQIKMALERTNAPLDVKIVQSSKKTLEQTPVQVIRPSRPQYDKMEQRHFDLRLQAMNKPQKELDIEAKLEKYRIEAERQAAKADRELRQEKELTEVKKDKKRKAMINKLQRNAGFMEDWEQKGIFEWEKNLRSKKQREQAELKFKITQATKMKTHADTIYEGARNDTVYGIEEFENKLQSLGITTHKANPHMTQSIVPAVKQTSTTVSALTLQERDIRRRTMVAKLMRHEESNEKQTRQDTLIRKLDVLAPLESQVAGDIWNVTNYTELILAHRKLRETRYDRRRDFDKELAEVKEKRCLELQHLSACKELELEVVRAKELEDALFRSQMYERGQVMKGVLDLMEEFAASAFDFQQKNDHAELDPYFRKGWETLFISGQDPEAVVEVDFEDYLAGKGEWETGEVVYNYKLGDIIEELLLKKFPVTDYRHWPELPSHRLRLAIVGYPYSGKTTLASLLQTRFNLDVIETYQIAQNVADEVLVEGETLSDEKLTAALIERIKKAEGEGWILVDFPSTLPQAKFLEQSLSGYLPPSERPIDLGELTRGEAAKIAPPTPKPKLPVGLIPSGLDYVIVLSCSKEECLRRVMLQRVDAASKLVYHLEDDPPAFTQDCLIENLQEIEALAHRAAFTDRMVAFDRDSKALKQWLSEFGSKQPVLLQLNTDCPVSDVAAELHSIISQLKAEVDEAYKARDRKEVQKAAETAAALQQIEDAKTLVSESILMLDEDTKETTLAPRPLPRVTSDQDCIEGLCELWETTQRLYTTTIKEVLRAERARRHEFVAELDIGQKAFIQFLSRPSEKQQIVLDFQFAFNEFSFTYPDLREDERTINELFQRVEDLCHKLWDINERREQEAQQELQSIRTSGFTEAHLDLTVAAAQTLMQGEVARYLSACQVIEDHYRELDQQPLTGVNETVPFINSEAPNPIDRLNALRDQSHAVQPLMLPEEEEKEKGKKKAPPPAKGKAAAQVVVEEAAKPPAHLQLKLEVLAVERRYFAATIARIHTWASKQISWMTASKDSILEKCGVWIACAYKAENDAVEALAEEIKDAIERQANLQPMLMMQELDLFVKHQVKTFEVQPPPPITFLK
jgi:molybdopterin-guanine dinucleotide biosynthesis protein